jgi:hypothetical protein
MGAIRSDFYLLGQETQGKGIAMLRQNGQHTPLQE